MGDVTWRSLPRALRRETLDLARRNLPASSPDIARVAVDHGRRMVRGGPAWAVLLALVVTATVYVVPAARTYWGALIVAGGLALALLPLAWPSRWAAVLVAVNARHLAPITEPLDELRVPARRRRWWLVVGAVVAAAPILYGVLDPDDVPRLIWNLCLLGLVVVLPQVLGYGKGAAWRRGPHHGTTLILDADGVRVPPLGLHVPWSGVSAVELWPTLALANEPMAVRFVLRDAPTVLASAQPPDERGAKQLRQRFANPRMALCFPLNALDVDPVLLLATAEHLRARSPVPG